MKKKNEALDKAKTILTKSNLLNNDEDIANMEKSIRKHEKKIQKNQTKYKKLKNARDDMRNTVNGRWTWLEAEKETVSERCANIFRNYCDSGRYTGRLEIEHTQREYDEQTDSMKVSKRGTINIKVRPPGKNQDVALSSLSGGERSFVSVCFVSTLWAAMDTPFKFLDEFDVFMDVKHRELAVNLLYKLGSRDSFGTKQLFLLTPNDVRSKEVIGNYDSEMCTVYCLKDPERRN